MSSVVTPPKLATKWVEADGARVDFWVKGLFEKADERISVVLVRHADERRREIAASIAAPRFPEAWGEFVAKYYEVPGPDGERCVSPIMPESKPHLTVWRFDGFEATATFNLTWLDADLWYNRSASTFKPAPPPVGDWEEVGPTDNYSTLWRRPMVKRGCQ